MNTINMNVTLRRADAAVLLTAARELVDLHKDDPKTFDAVMKYIKTYGIDVRKLSNGAAVAFWIDDKRIDTILSARVRELPEFLADEEYGVRLLAMHRLNLLTGGREMTNAEASSESLSKALEIALVDAIKVHSLRYCKCKRKFYVTRDMREHVPQVILKRSFVCEYIACIHRSNCLAIALKEGLKEDLLEFHRAWHRALSLERSLTLYNK